MIARTLSSKNQVTIPKSVREQLGVKSHQSIGFTRIHNNIVIIPVKKSNRQAKIKNFWHKIHENTKKYGSDDTSYNWGKDIGNEKLGDK